MFEKYEFLFRSPQAPLLKDITESPSFKGGG